MDIRTKISSWGGRKFILAAFVIFAAFSLKLFGLMTEAGLITLSLTSLGLFSGANVTQKATAKTAKDTTKAEKEKE